MPLRMDQELDWDMDWCLWIDQGIGDWIEGRNDQDRWNGWLEAGSAEHASAAYKKVLPSFCNALP